MPDRFPGHEGMLDRLPQIRSTTRSTSPDLSLTRSFHATGQPAAFLIRPGLLVVWLQLGVPGFCPVLARGWHEDASPYHLGAYGSLEVVSAAQPTNSSRFKALLVDVVAALCCCTGARLTALGTRRCGQFLG